jgi:hypothetical protein
MRQIISLRNMLRILAIAVILPGALAQLGRGAASSNDQLPPEKQGIEQRYEQMRQEALRGQEGPQAQERRQASKPGVLEQLEIRPGAGVPPAEIWPTGIIQEGQAPFPSALYTFQNQWHEILDGAHVQAYAGSLTDDPSEGIIAIQVTSLDLSTVSTQIYPTPSRAGAVRIVAADGPRLGLAAANGATFVFNVATRTFNGG